MDQHDAVMSRVDALEAVVSALKQQGVLTAEICKSAAQEAVKAHMDQHEAPPVGELGPPLPDVSEPPMIVQTPVVEAHPWVECVTPAPESALPMSATTPVAMSSAPTGDCTAPVQTRRRLKRKARKAESDDDAWMEEAKRDADIDQVSLTEAFHQNIDRMRCPGGHSMTLSVAGPGRLLCSCSRSCGNHVYEGAAYATCTEGDFFACEACLMRYLQEALQPGPASEP